METRKLLLIIALATMVVITTGCTVLPGKYTGGGWIPGVEGGKATFGFQMRFDGETVTGQVQYNDHGPNGVKFHGVVDDMVWLTEASGYGTGTATVTPGGETGTFGIYIADNGEPGAMDPADFIWVTLTTPSGTYSNSGNLGGGNIQYHPD